MRLWHKDLISVLPQKQLIGQWRECCAIARNIAVNGTPNHILVNKVLDYPPTHFISYSGLVHEELTKRGYKCDWNKFIHWMAKWPDGKVKYYTKLLFENWHNDRYLKQCLCNLEEKYDCGGISELQWYTIVRFVSNKVNVRLTDIERLTGIERS